MQAQIGFLLAITFIGQSTSEIPALDGSQVKQIASIRAEAKKEAAPQALKLARLISQANENMLADTPDEKIAKSLHEEIRTELHELLEIKLRVTKRSLKVLTSQQRAALKQELKKPNAPADLMEAMIALFHLPKD